MAPSQPGIAPAFLSGSTGAIRGLLPGAPLKFAHEDFENYSLMFLPNWKPGPIEKRTVLRPLWSRSLNR
jgi:hypothetical protein